MSVYTLRQRLNNLANSESDQDDDIFVMALARIDELERQLAEAQKDQADAKPYRWIVKNIEEKGCAKFDEYFYTSFESLSDYIDAAIQKVKP